MSIGFGKAGIHTSKHTLSNLDPVNEHTGSIIVFSFHQRKCTINIEVRNKFSEGKNE
jgi:hypothetical protein